MNTKITILYRDGANYKFFNDIVVKGRVTLDELAQHCEQNHSFIPHCVGLPAPDVPFAFDTEIDHPWHEIDSVELTDESPNFYLSAGELLNQFANASKQHWDEYYVPK